MNDRNKNKADKRQKSTVSVPSCHNNVNTTILSNANATPKNNVNATPSNEDKTSTRIRSFLRVIGVNPNFNVEQNNAVDIQSSYSNTKSLKQILFMSPEKNAQESNSDSSKYGLGMMK